jgi:alpha-2-macroglobulin-like protein
MKTLNNFLIMIVLFCCTNAFAQQNQYSVTKEKIYVHTNHIFFKPGETLYYKLYVIQASTQTPAITSGVVYVDVISPAGTVVENQKFAVVDGAAEGSFEFNQQAVGGVYKLKAYTTWMRNETDSTFFTKEITVQKTIAPRILMKLDFAQKGYGAGDKVVANFSMRNLNDEAIKFYAFKYTVAIAGKQILTNQAKTNNEGKADVQFELPKDLNSNDCLLNITIEYDAYTESISRSIPIVLNNIDLQFMPEGGALVNAIKANVAFKAVNEFGKPVDIKASLYDENNTLVATLESYKFGMGKFEFTPQIGKTYFTKITSPTNIDREYKLPTAQNYGMVCNVSQDDENIILKINSTQEQDCKIVAQLKNIIYYEKKYTVANGDQIIKVKKSLFPVGIAQFTIYTSNNLPVIERLVFVNENKNLQVSITTNKKQYGPREKVEMQLKTTDYKGNPVPSNFSLAIVDDKLYSFADDKQNHILSWLLLHSELSGTIEEPTFYFKHDEPKALPALDLVMLTNGYRYFDFIDYVRNNKQLKYAPDQQNIISGIVVNNNNEPVKANLYLANPAVNGKAMKITTDKTGKFFFSNLTSNQHYVLLSQSLKKQATKINILQNGIGYNPTTNIALNIDNNIQDKMPAIRTLAFARQKDVAEKSKIRAEKRLDDFINNDPALMQEVVVVAYGTQRKMDVTAAVAIVKANELNDVAKLENALAGKVAGLQVGNNVNVIGNAPIAIRGVQSLTGNNQPLIIVDGIECDANALSKLNPNDVNSVDVLKGSAATAIYGAQSASGAILVTTKKFRTFTNSKALNRNSFIAMQSFYAIGTVYTPLKKYYAPKYETIKTENRTDFRETIYWNPTVQTDKDGNATIVFYNSDATTTFRAIAEGIGFNGVLGRIEKTYSVQNDLAVDAKIPPYLTVGDKALIPLVIKNNNDVATTVNVIVEVPNNMICKDCNTEITLNANESKQVLLPIEAIKATKGIVKFIVYNNNNKEIISLPIEANNKGFTVIQTFAGNASQQHQFNINKLIPGTLSTTIKLFNSVEGQLLNGIESMLREPGGCFEQTSSTTYPNVFILKYLKESGKSNPDIEAKAKRYIENGYKRLAGFETAMNGFEWFGNTPPHEALTAYGLLEFTDMQEFVDVDAKMIKRTKDFLLNRRDGKGMFKLSTGGYDRFASVPNNIANIYIVYALTQAGIGNEIKLEYETALNTALKSNDGYQLAMMANAAHNMKNDKDFNTLIAKLNDRYKLKNLASETSVVNSRDASLRVEALSLYVMALCCQKNPDIELIAEIVTKILGEKSYYGYGSTQATVLALNAVVSYSKLINTASKQSKIEFVLNNKIIDTSVVEADYADGKNIVAIKYQDVQNKIPYNYEVAYNTYTPLNSPKAALNLAINYNNKTPMVGQTVRMEIKVNNKENIMQPMAIAKLGIPAGLIIQPWQLKEMMEKKEIAYYEIFDNYLVLYWMGYDVNETKTINLDLKATIEGTYRAKASNVYLYYTPEHKHWIDSETIEVQQ